jgi:hypothetical protein
MRNAVDQDDEQTQGVDKRSLLGGVHAAPVPDPGTMKSEQPKPAQPIVRRSTSFAPVKPEIKAAPPAPAPPRASVEVIEGAKKRSVDFPQQ